MIRVNKGFFNKNFLKGIIIECGRPAACRANNVPGRDRVIDRKHAVNPSLARTVYSSIALLRLIDSVQIRRI